MQPYTGFASLYDIFMDNVPYDEWADYTQETLRQFHIDKGLILELACGTGNMTERLADMGYEVIGIDSSEEMLSIAREKSDLNGSNILYLCQDMRDFELYGTVSAAISVCDSMNYLLSEEELLRVFKLVNNYLDPKGIFLFDYDTKYAYETVLGDNTIAESREEGSFIWENTYYEEDMMNEIHLSIFVPETKNADLYRKYEEVHHRKTYPLSTIRKLIEESGMEWVGAYDSATGFEPTEVSERLYIIAREQFQEGKVYLKEA